MSPTSDPRNAPLAPEPLGLSASTARARVVRCPANGVASVEASARVLVLENDPTFAESLARLLSTGAHRVKIASPDPRYRAELHRHLDWADVIVCDLRLPEPVKLRVYEQIKRIRPTMAWVFASSDANNPSVRTIGRDGHPIVRRPFTARDLRAAVARTLTRRSGTIPSVRPGADGPPRLG